MASRQLRVDVLTKAVVYGHPKTVRNAKSKFDAWMVNGTRQVLHVSLPVSDKVWIPRKFSKNLTRLFLEWIRRWSRPFIGLEYNTAGRRSGTSAGTSSKTQTFPRRRVIFSTPWPWRTTPLNWTGKQLLFRQKFELVSSSTWSVLQLLALVLQVSVHVPGRRQDPQSGRCVCHRSRGHVVQCRENPRLVLRQEELGQNRWHVSGKINWCPPQWTASSRLNFLMEAQTQKDHRKILQFVSSIFATILFQLLGKIRQLRGIHSSGSKGVLSKCRAWLTKCQLVWPHPMITKRFVSPFYHCVGK